MYKHFLKRLIDIAISFIVLLVISPFLLITAVCVHFDSPGPVFFLQKRLGKKGKIFTIYKFRTMTDKERHNDYEIFKDDPEVTFTGKFLRRFKIDELPQLLNILKGDMSIVGPRPAMPDQLEELDENGIKRLEVTPGLTGLAQINGNIYLDWPDRWKYDRYYVEHLSFWLDMKIVMKTVLIFFRSEDTFINKPQ
ncbi:sugar transferase [Bacteroidia bacterium]|nr:sugar transferase [Bacteroidia bacterium]